MGKNICTTCDRLMSDETDECDANYEVTYPDGLVLPVSLEHFSEPDGRCHDCSVKHDRQHHPGCDVERCPRCGGQRITCGCEPSEVAHYLLKRNYIGVDISEEYCRKTSDLG